MKTVSRALAKGTMATVAAGAVAMASASPAMARDYDRHDRYDRDDDIDVGDVIAGALIIGGIAAVVSSIDDDDDDRYRGRRYNRGGYARGAIERCVRAAERTANRYSWGGRSQVTEIRDVDRERDGYEVKGRIAVNAGGRDWRYGRRGYDSGRFTCEVRYGRVTDLDFDGIRGLR